MKANAKELRQAVIGRQAEIGFVRACIGAGKNVLLEGPVGVGKTHLAAEVARELGRPVFRVDGDSRYTEQKLAGSFDPAAVMTAGYVETSFLPGPLVQAMRAGGILFINELNRMSEGVQNVLLPAIDEGIVQIPRLGEIKAAPGFAVIATQNPKEFVATSHLSEAILDRFEWVELEYQPEDEEVEIVKRSVGKSKLAASVTDFLARVAVRAVRFTRDWPGVSRGASVRAAVSLFQIAENLLSGDPTKPERALESAAKLALPTRIQIEPGTGEDGATVDRAELIDLWIRRAAEEIRSGSNEASAGKKKS